ncbi:hypothetical protein GQ42DRAFT_163963 [Ramicandelaber brevisporus]|nr:hypothetical protein GQ42DRAFT_163963 [Ramicandelaber brevisporus]
MLGPKAACLSLKVSLVATTTTAACTTRPALEISRRNSATSGSSGGKDGDDKDDDKDDRFSLTVLISGLVMYAVCVCVCV